jgi:phage-related minor tail protein
MSKAHRQLERSIVDDDTKRLVVVQTVATAAPPELVRNWRTLWGLLGGADLKARASASAQKALDAGDAKLDAVVFESQKLQAELRKLNAEAALLEQQQRKLAAETRAENAKASRDEAKARRTDSERIRDELLFLESKGYVIRAVAGEDECTIQVSKQLESPERLLVSRSGDSIK